MKLNPMSSKIRSIDSPLFNRMTVMNSFQLDGNEFSPKALEKNITISHVLITTQIIK